MRGQEGAHLEIRNVEILYAANLTTVYIDLSVNHGRTARGVRDVHGRPWRRTVNDVGL